MDKILNILIGVMCFAIIGLIFSLGILTGMYKTLDNRGLITSKEVINKTNLSTSEIAILLNQEVSQFYIYNHSNWVKTLNVTQLKTEGGVCRHYAQYYVDRAKEYGLMGQTVSFWGNQSIGHMVALIYDDKLEEYCILDQSVYPRCVRLGSADVGT